MAEKSFIHSADLARAIWLTIDRAPPGGVYNVGPKQPWPIREIIEMLANLLGKRLNDIAYEAPERMAEDSRYWLDSEAAKSVLGWEPVIEWPEGLDSMVKWARAYWTELEHAPTDYVMRG